uniref:Rho-GAP domain-containing protein n=1 Tax=Arcella intermedia TaxID=1963864 RepID=A0A6B2LK19_9EUKA
MATLMGHPFNCGLPVPLLVDRCVSFLMLPECLSTEGLFRISVAAPSLDKLKKQWDSGYDVEFERHDIHEVACLLKLYIRELPETLCHSLKSGEWQEAMLSPSPEKDIASLLSRLPPTNREIIKSLFGLLKRVEEKSAINKMTSTNLAVCWSPTLFKEDDFGLAQVFLQVTSFMIVHLDSLFN